MSDNSTSGLENIEPTPGSQKPDPILKVDNVVRSFGGLRAVDIDHLEVQRGIITAFIGQNGAGKTNMFNPVSYNNLTLPKKASAAFWVCDV